MDRDPGVGKYYGAALVRVLRFFSDLSNLVSWALGGPAVQSFEFFWFQTVSIPTLSRFTQSSLNEGILIEKYSWILGKRNEKTTLKNRSYQLCPPQGHLARCWPAANRRRYKLCGPFPVGLEPGRGFHSLSKTMTTFQPRPGDACTWIPETAFYDFDDELEEQDLSLQDLQIGYEILHKAFTEANISFAAIGDFVFSIMGGRKDPTHDVDFQINSTPVELFTKLRTIEKYVYHTGRTFRSLTDYFLRLRLKIGLQADNFRVHCNIGTDKWMGVNMLMTSKTRFYNPFRGSLTPTTNRKEPWRDFGRI